MSIINEALKKVEEEKKKKIDTAPEKEFERPIKTASRPIKKSSARPGGNKRLAFFLMLLLLVIGVIFVQKFLPELPKAPSKEISNIQPELPKAPSKEISNIQPESKKENKEEIAPSPPPPAEPPALTLNGIVYDKQRPYAIINNKILTKGEVIEGATLVEINKDSVKLSFKEKEFELSAR